MAQLEKNPPAMWETWVPSLGWEDSLEKEMATHSVLLPRKSHGRRSLVQATVHGVTKSRIRLSDFTFTSLMKVHGHEWPESKMSQHACVSYSHITTYKE